MSTITAPKGVRPEDFIAYTFECSQKEQRDAKGKVTRVNTIPLSVGFDFTGVSRSALQSEAIRSLAIKLQSEIRGSTKRKRDPLPWNKAVALYNGLVVKVGDHLGQRRAKVPFASKVAKGAEKVTDAELAQAIKDLQAIERSRKAASK